MKKLLLSAVFTLSIFAVFAFNNNTRLVIAGATSNNIKIFIDGYNVSDKYRNGSSYIIDDLSVSNHRVQILKQKTSIFGVTQDKVIYDQNLYFKTNSQTNLSITVFGTVDINETPIYGNGNGGGWNSGNNNDQPQCGNDNGKGKKNGHRKHHKKKKYDCDDRRTSNNNDWED